MNNHLFLKDIESLKKLNELCKEDNTWRTRREIRKLRKSINKMIKIACKLAAKATYEQTYKFYQDILNSNLD